MAWPKGVPRGTKLEHSSAEEQVAHNDPVAGSNPAAPTTEKDNMTLRRVRFKEPVEFKWGTQTMQVITSRSGIDGVGHIERDALGWIWLNSDSGYTVGSPPTNVLFAEV